MRPKPLPTSTINPMRNYHSLRHLPRRPRRSNSLLPRTTLCRWLKHTGQRTHNLSTPHGVGNGHFLLKIAPSRQSFKTQFHSYSATSSLSIHSPLGETRPSLFETPSTKLLRPRVSTISQTVSPRTGTLGSGSRPSYVLPLFFPFPPSFSSP